MPQYEEHRLSSKAQGKPLGQVVGQAGGNVGYKPPKVIIGKAAKPSGTFVQEQTMKYDPKTERKEGQESNRARRMTLGKALRRLNVAKRKRENLNK